MLENLVDSYASCILETKNPRHPETAPKPETWLAVGGRMFRPRTDHSPGTWVQWEVACRRVLVSVVAYRWAIRTS